MVGWRCLMANGEMKEQSMVQVGPPITHAGKVAVWHSATDIVLSFASARAILDPNTGAPGKAVALEWSHSIGMSPILADHLHKVLTHVLEEYKKSFGSIPVDPQFKIEKPK